MRSGPRFDSWLGSSLFALLTEDDCLNISDATLLLHVRHLGEDIVALSEFFTRWYEP